MKSVRPELVEGREPASWFDKLTTNGRVSSPRMVGVSSLRTAGGSRRERVSVPFVLSLSKGEFSHQSTTSVVRHCGGGRNPDGRICPQLSNADRNPPFQT